MITKAGAAANQVVVSIASGGRSFGMVDHSCTGPNCLYQGPNSTAPPGVCTGTAGYISLAELQLAINFGAQGTTTEYDAASHSDMVVYGITSSNLAPYVNIWPTYMSYATKASRISRY